VPRIRGPGHHRPCWPRPWTRTARHRSPPGLLRRARSRHTPLRLIDPQRGASLTAATRGSSAPHSCPPSPHYAPTPPPGPTTSPNTTKTKRLGPGRPHPGPPPHPDPARHDPQPHPPTSHETTHRRSTHHTEAPPPCDLDEHAHRHHRRTDGNRRRYSKMMRGGSHRGQSEMGGAYVNFSLHPRPRHNPRPLPLESVALGDRYLDRLDVQRCL